MNLISVKATQKDIVIRIPISLLKFAQENKEDPILIFDKTAMAEWIVENFLEMNRGYSEYTAFQEYLDTLFIEALEGGEDWLGFPEEIEENNGYLDAVLKGFKSSAETIDGIISTLHGEIKDLVIHD